MQSKIVIVGLAMIIVAFSTRMLFDNQIRLLIVGVPEQEGLFPPDFPRGGGEFPPLDEEGQIPFQGGPGGRGFRQGGAGGGGGKKTVGVAATLPILTDKDIEPEVMYLYPGVV